PHAVDADDDVLDSNAGLLGGRVRIDLVDQRSRVRGELVRGGDVGSHVLDAYAEQSAPHRARRNELLHDRADHVDGNREADADVAAGARNDRGIDADELAVQVDE